VNVVLCNVAELKQQQYTIKVENVKLTLLFEHRWLLPCSIITHCESETQERCSIRPNTQTGKRMRCIPLSSFRSFSGVMVHSCRFSPNTQWALVGFTYSDWFNCLCVEEIWWDLHYE